MNIRQLNLTVFELPKESVERRHKSACSAENEFVMRTFTVSTTEAQLKKSVNFINILRKVFSNSIFTFCGP